MLPILQLEIEGREEAHPALGSVFNRLSSGRVGGEWLCSYPKEREEYLLSGISGKAGE